MNLDEVTGMPALPENQFWRILPGHWTMGWSRETMLVRLMQKTAEGDVPLYQAPLMIPSPMYESQEGITYKYGMALEYTPENFRFIAEHILKDKPVSVFGDQFGRLTSAETFNNQYKGDYPPRSMR